MTKNRVVRDTQRNFIKFNPVLLAGTTAQELDTLKSKLGDGNTPYRDLPYEQGSGGDEAPSVYDFVVGEGGDYDTLSEALAHVAAGSSIFVKSGTYAEAGGTFSQDNLTITGSGMSSAVLVLSGNLSLTGNNLSIKHLTVDTNSSKYFRPLGQFNTINTVGVINGTVTVFFKSGLFNNVSNCKIIAASATATIECDERNRWTGNHLTVPHLTEGGMNLGFYSTLTGNFFYRYAQLVQGGPLVFAHGERCIISGNTFFCGLGAAITTDFRCAITGNSIFQGGANSIWVIDGCTVSGNAIMLGQSGAAIFANGSTEGYSVTITGNDISDSGVNPPNPAPQSGHYGIKLGTGQQRAVISGNSISGVQYGVLVQEGATDTVISGNAFNFVTEAVQDDGTGTIIRSNSGVADNAV